MALHAGYAVILREQHFLLMKDIYVDSIERGEREKIIVRLGTYSILD